MITRQDTDFINCIKQFDSNVRAPYYIYFKEKIIENINNFQYITYQNKSIHFATMANINQKFLSILKNESIKVFVNSLNHLNAVKKAGYKSDDIIFTASALSTEMMHIISNNNILINLDSLLQVKKWEKQTPHKPYGIRFNIGDNVEPHESSAGFFIGKNSRLGVTIDELMSLKDNSKVECIHLYAGTNIMNVDYLLDCYKEVTKAAHYFPGLKSLDFGGGFGIDDNNLNNSFDFERYGYLVSELMSKTSYQLNRNLKLILEPGRILGGNSAFFVCKVTDVKIRDNLQLVGVNASSTQFPRPLFYPDKARHPVYIISNNLKSDDKLDSSIYGCSTYSRDFLATNIKLPPVQDNDVIIFGNAGSYCSSMTTDFLGFPKPEEFFI